MGTDTETNRQTLQRNQGTLKKMSRKDWRNQKLQNIRRKQPCLMTMLTKKTTLRELHFQLECNKGFRWRIKELENKLLKVNFLT